MTTTETVVAGTLLTAAAIGGTLILAPDEITTEPIDTPAIVEVVEPRQFNYIFLESDGSYKGALCRNCVETEEEGRTLVEVTAEQAEEISLGYDVAVVQGVVLVQKGSKAIARQNEKKTAENNAIYKQIGELEILKLGKESSGADTADETTKITELKAQLQ